MAFLGTVGPHKKPMVSNVKTAVFGVLGLSTHCVFWKKYQRGLLKGLGPARVTLSKPCKLSVGQVSFHFSAPSFYLTVNKRR